MSSDFYKFTIVNNEITSVEEYDDGVWEVKSLDDDNETWTYNPTTKVVTKTETKRGVTETDTYSDPDANGIYTKLSGSDSSSGGSSGSKSSFKQYDFTIDVDGNITAVFELKNGVWVEKSLDDDDEVWTYDDKGTTDDSDDTVTRTETHDGYTETNTFTRNADGYFTRSRESHSIGDDDSSNNEIGDDSVDDDFLYGYDDDDDNFKSGKGDDHIESYDGDDTIDGGLGDDYLDSGDGDDSVNGGSGNDIIVAGSGMGNDKYNGSGGEDTIKYTSATSGVEVNLGKKYAKGDDIDDDSITNVENIIGGSGNDALTGDSKSNKIYGDEGDDTVDGGRGKDLMDGGAGNDVYVVSDKGDQVVEDADSGEDTVQTSLNNYTLSDNVETLVIIGKSKVGVSGNALDNTITGNSNANKIFGLAGDDTINGDAGKDTLSGGIGDDTLTGGAGNDMFVWDATDHGDAGTPSIDTITDFILTDKDVINLKGLLDGESKSNVTGLLNYLDITVSGGNTTIHISTTGEFDGGVYDSAKEDATIVLSGVDLVGVLTEEQLLNSLISSKALLVD